MKIVPKLITELVVSGMSGITIVVPSPLALRVIFISSASSTFIYNNSENLIASSGRHKISRSIIDFFGITPDLFTIE